MPSEHFNRPPPTPNFPELPTTGEMPIDFLPLVLRSAVVVSPRAQYWSWAASCPSARSAAKPGWWKGSAFLIPAYSESSRLNAHIDEHCQYILAQALSFVTDQVDDWPRDRGAAMLRAWFDLQVVHGVFDVTGEPITVMSED